MKSIYSLAIVLLIFSSCEERSSPTRKSQKSNNAIYGAPNMSSVRDLSPVQPHSDDTFSHSEPMSEDEVAYFSGSARDIGLEYGKKYGDSMKTLINRWLRGHMIAAALPGPFRFQKNITAMTNFLPDYYKQEVEAIAEAASVKPKKIYEANFASDLLQFAMTPFGCSTYVVMPERSKTGSMIYARNLDYFGSNILRENWKPIVFHRDGFQKVLSISVPGHSGVMTGINESGVMMTIMVSFSDVDYNNNGLSSLFVFRSVLERATTAKEAQKLYIDAVRTVPVNVMIADGQDAIVVEADVARHAIRLPGASGTLYAANHFEDPIIQAKKHGRDKRWPILAQFDQGTDKLGLEDVKKVLAEAAEANPAYIAQNILGVVVDFGRREIIFGGDSPVAINGRLKVINYGEIFENLN